MTRLLAALCLLALPLPALAQAPLAANDVVATTAGTPIAIDVLANDSDPDGDPVDLTGVEAPAHGTVTFAGAIVTYTPTAGFAGIDHFLYTISDGSNTARAAVSVYVDEPLPPPPVLTLTPSFLDFGEVAIDKTRDLVLTVTNNTAPPVELAENILVDQAAPTPFDASDYLAPDGCRQVAARTLDPGESCTQKVRFYSVAGADAVSPTQMRLFDGNTFAPIAIVPLFAAVGPPDAGANSPPSAVADLAGVAPGFTHILDATRNDSDPDDDHLRMTFVSDPLHGTAAVVSCAPLFPLNPNTDCIQYVPDAGYVGIDAVPYTVSDGRGGAASATYHLAVGNVVPNVAAITPNSGPTSGGQAVRITGSNFVYGSEAAFLCPSAGTLPLTLTALTDTEILATTPASLPGVCALRVVTRLGRTGQLANAYTYEGNAPVDTDGDGVLDATDNCPLTPNPSQANADGDAQGDACDPDDDNDGSADVSDNCPLHANPDQADNDADGLGNVCDPDDDNDGQADADEVACGSNPLSAASNAPDRDSDGRPDCVDPDDDNDGVADGSDNCPRVPNANQADADQDGLGDACDPTPLPGRTIVFSRRTGTPSNYRIFKMQADGSNVTQLTTSTSFYSEDREPALSPDGTYVAFMRVTYLGLDIYKIDMNGSPNALVRLTGAGMGSDGYPAWSPDGTKIAYSCGARICVMNQNGSTVTTLTKGPANGMAPSWSPDGTKIAFVSSLAGNFEIHVMNADGSGVTRLTNHSATEWAPTWSPDGTRIAFTTNRHGSDNWELYSINANPAAGPGLVRLSNRSGQDLAPAWGPSGEIVFHSSVSGVLRMNADGSGVTVLSSGIEPNW